MLQESDMKLSVAERIVVGLVPILPGLSIMVFAAQMFWCLRFEEYRSDAAR